MREALCNAFYADLGITPQEVFVSDGAKCDIARLQVCGLVLGHMRLPSWQQTKHVAHLMSFREALLLLWSALCHIQS